VRDGKPKSWERNGNPQPSPIIVEGKVQRLSRKGVVPTLCRAEAPRPQYWGDDIVHPFWKQEDKCNAMVVGSSPTRGASKNNPILCGFFLTNHGVRTFGEIVSSGRAN